MTSYGSLTTIIGQVLSTSVAYVEATLNTGEVVRDPGGDQAFVIYAPQDVYICELRAVGSEGEVLKSDRVAPPETGDLCR